MHKSFLMKPHHELIKTFIHVFFNTECILSLQPYTIDRDSKLKKSRKKSANLSVEFRQRLVHYLVATILLDRVLHAWRGILDMRLCARVRK